MPRLNKESAPKVQDAGPAVDRNGDLDDITVNFVTIRQSHSLAPLLRGLPGDSCQCPHWGYLLKGKALLRLADGRELEINEGDLYYCPPGHKLYAIEAFENLEFNPAREAEQTMNAFTSNIARADT